MSCDRDCPKCGEPMELVDDDPDCGINGGWECTNEECGHQASYEPLDESDMFLTAERPLPGRVGDD